jgi:hypothetical protein
VLLVGAPMLLAGCAMPPPPGDMVSVRVTADKAMSTAEEALRTAQRADAKADKALSEIQALTERVDRMFQHNLRK